MVKFQIWIDFGLLLQIFLVFPQVFELLIVRNHIDLSTINLFLIRILAISSIEIAARYPEIHLVIMVSDVFYIVLCVVLAVLLILLIVEMLSQLLGVKYLLL